jgi:hypothetical protein
MVSISFSERIFTPYYYLLFYPGRGIKNYESGITVVRKELLTLSCFLFLLFIFSSMKSASSRTPPSSLSHPELVLRSLVHSSSLTQDLVGLLGIVTTSTPYRPQRIIIIIFYSL